MFEVGDFVAHFKGGVYQIVYKGESRRLAEHQSMTLKIKSEEGIVSINCIAASKIEEGDLCFVYKSSTQKYWIRPCAEFGEIISTQRFVKIA